MKRIWLFLYLLVLCAEFAESSDVSRKLGWYAGGGADCNFPVFLGGERSAFMSLLGLGATVEGGVDFRGWQFGGLISGTYFWEGDGSMGLFEKTGLFRFEAAAARTLDDSLIPAFPHWFGMRPQVTVGGGLVILSHWQNNWDKERNRDLKYATTGMFIAGTGYYLDFHVLPNLTIYTGPSVTLWADSHGVMGYPTMTLGVRAHSPRPAKKVVKADASEARIKVLLTENVDETVSADFWVDVNDEITKWYFTIKDPVGATVFRKHGGKNVPKRINFEDNLFIPGAAYQCNFQITGKNIGTAEDESPFLKEIREVRTADGKIKITSSSIEFQANKNTYDELPQEKREINERILDEFANILKKYQSGYTHLIVGHANGLEIKTEQDMAQADEISLSRAESVRKALIKRGVPAAALQAQGHGGREPVTTKKKEGWKNRRVEIIIEEIH